MRRLSFALLLALSLSPAFGAVPPPVPALPDTERRTAYSISGTTCGCNVNFAIFGDGTDFQNWLEVYLNGVLVNYNDATFGWTITSPTGSLATIPRPITDAVLTFTNAQTGTVQIVGARRPRRVSQFNENTGVPARNLNQVITDIIAMVRETWDKINDVTGRALMGPPGETISLLPSAANRAGKFATYDGSGNPAVTSPSLGTGNVIGPGSSVNGHVATYAGTGGTQLADGGPIRTALSSPVILYVNPSSSTAANCNGLTGSAGNDSNAGTLAAPFLTPNHALNIALTNYDVRQSQVTIQYCDNNVTAASYPVLSMTANMLGAISAGSASAAQLIVQGNSTTPSNVTVQGNGSSAFTFVGVTSPVGVINMQIGATLVGGATSGHGIQADAHSMVYYSNITWGFISTGWSHMVATYGSFIEQEGVEKIIGGASLHWFADRVSQILTTGQTITCTGTPAFPSAFVGITNGAVFTLNSAAFSGCGSATGPKYIADTTSSFGSGSADPNSLFPGNSNGSVVLPSFGLTGLLLGNGGSPTGGASPVTTIVPGAGVAAALANATNGAGGAMVPASVLCSPTAPTITSGFGGGTPAISAPNGTCAFRVTIGTGSGSTGVLGLPTAANGWDCWANDLTTKTAGNAFVMQNASGSTTSAAAFTSYSDVMGAATWVAADVIAISCHAF